ncbi:MAG: hypothetical protein GY862_04330, partial [Gammaproteobacteria bacterium]|nr:hypothetical protein [Gammaproteobacteria bacterium]
MIPYQYKRRSGKTSLLKYLKNIARAPQEDLRPDQPQGWGDWMPRDFQFALVDFQAAGMREEQSLLRNILKQLNFQAPEPCDLIQFSDILDERISKPKQTLNYSETTKYAKHAKIQFFRTASLIGLWTNFTAAPGTAL